MLAGKDRGKTGKVLHVFPKEMRVVIEGLNKIKKNVKAKKQGQKSQIIEKERAVSISNVQIVCSKCGKASRFGMRIEGENKVRYCKKCQSIL